jgi:tetratricopeptide (TPR) repeat protein
MKGAITILLFFFIVIHVFPSCKGQPSIPLPPKDCIELNNQGVDYLVGKRALDEHALVKAIELLKQAIKCDTTYITAYMSIAIAYDRAKNYNQELESYNRILVLFKNYPWIMLEKAMLFERMGKIDSAKNVYNLSGIEIEQRLSKRPANINLIKALVQLKALTLGKDAAIEEINKEEELHPKLSSDLEFERSFYSDFDHHSYVFRTTFERTIDK